MLHVRLDIHCVWIQIWAGVGGTLKGNQLLPENEVKTQ